jgi:hypothetical protein
MICYRHVYITLYTVQAYDCIWATFCIRFAPEAKFACDLLNSAGDVDLASIGPPIQ